MELGDHIELSGFEYGSDELVVIKKLVGNYVKKFSEHHPDFDRLHLHEKRIHSDSYEITGTLTAGGQNVHASVTDDNVYFALDSCLKKLETQIIK